MRRAFFFIVAVCLATSSFASIPRASALDLSSPRFDPLPESRIRVSEDLAPFERPAPSLLSRALRQGYEQASTTNASGLAGFLSVDPIIPTAALREPQRWNRYAYVSNNPMKYADPTGKLLEVRAGACSDSNKDCYARLQTFNALQSWVGKDAAKYLQLGKNGQVTLKGISASAFAKFGSAAGTVANLIRSTDRTAAFALSSDAQGGAHTDPMEGGGGTITKINPSSLPSFDGGVAQTMDTAMAHELGGHALMDMWGISPFNKAFGSMDQRFTLGVPWGEAFAVTMENQYRASQGMDIRGYYLNKYDYDPPPGAPKP